MMSQALYRKYRPRTWDEVVGQQHVVQTLRNAIAKDRVGHAFLFAGPRGTGKTTLARILAKAVNCLAPDVGARPCNACEHCRAVNEYRFLDLIEMDAASNTGVDNVRELRDRIGFAPSQGRFKVYIIDEVHMLSTAAFNALLKTLEEPPPHAIFVLATTEIDRIPATVLSRCQRHEFRTVPLSDIITNLKGIVEKEGLQADDAALELIARQATGSIRDAQSLLDQLASSQSRITLELTQPVLGTAASGAVLEILDGIQSGQSTIAMGALRRALDSGVDPRTLAKQLIEYLRGLMLQQLGNSEQVQVTKEIRERMLVHAAAFPRQRVISLVQRFNGAATDSHGAWQPSLALELAVAECFSEAERASERRNGAPTGGALGGDRSERPTRVASPPSEKGTASSAQALYQRADDQTPAESADTSRAGSAPTEHSDRPSQTHIDLAQIAAVWRDIRGALKRTHPAVDGLLNSCKPVEMQGDMLVLGFQSEAVRTIMDRPENLEAARRAIDTVLKVPVRIRCVVISARGKVPPNIPQDGMVATALNQGGKIVDVQE